MRLKFYKYLFYQSYLAKFEGWGKYQFPEQWAVIDMSFALLYNFFSTLIFIKIVFHRQWVFSLSGLNGVVYLLATSPILFFHYYLFLYKKKYKKIIKEFSKLQGIDTPVKVFFGRFYSLLSLILFFLMLVFMVLYSH